MQGGLSHERNVGRFVRPSGRLTNAQIVIKQKTFCPDFYTA